MKQRDAKIGVTGTCIIHVRRTVVSRAAGHVLGVPKYQSTKQMLSLNTLHSSQIYIMLHFLQVQTVTD